MAADRCQLTSARVQHFRCLEDTGVVPIDDVTVLLAENENGKTAFLQALAWFSQEEQFDEEDRWAGAPNGTLPILTLEFELSKAARQALKDAGFVDVRNVQMTVDTDNKVSVLDSTTSGSIERRPRPAAAIENARAQVLSGLERATSAYPAQQVELSRMIALLELPKPDSDTVEAVSVLYEETFGPAAIDEALADDLTKLKALTAVDPDSDSAPYSVLFPRLPKLIYFDGDVDVLPDKATYEEIAAAPEDHRTIVNVGRLVDIDLAKVSADAHKRRALAKKATTRLTEETSKYWSGDPVTIDISLDESEVVLSVDSAGRVQKPTRRSRGRQWYLGFYVNFRAETRNELRDAVLLIDEPGLALHLKNQASLLNLFDEIATDNQIVYSTHIPALIPREKPHRLRLFVPGDREGTVRIESKVHAVKSNADVLRPVRAAIGLGIADSISLGTTTVVAEGISDPYLIQTMSRICRDADKSALNVSATVLPAGGAGTKMLPLVSFIAAEHTKGVVLVDDDTTGRSAEREIRKRFAGLVPVVRTHDTDTETPASGLEIEDLFDRGYFLGLVNDSHKDVEGYEAFGVADLDDAKPVCDAVAAAFKAKGLGSFQKLRPARELQVRYELGGENPDDATVDRFSELFRRLSAAIKRK